MTPSNSYDPKCRGCQYSHGGNVDGDIVTLPGDWCLNHYAGSEGYLGWLALQPKRHCMALGELLPGELTSLGPNLQDVDHVIAQYWAMTFNDPIERMYVVYFFESAASDPFHLHIHLIPRFTSLETRLRAWEIPKATMSATFPAQYRRTAPQFGSAVEALMNHLRSNLQTNVAA